MRTNGLLLLLIPLLLGACSVRGAPTLEEPFTVDVHITEDLIRFGELAIWIEDPRGRFTELGTVPPGEERSFSFEVRYSGLYRMQALRENESRNISGYAGEPQGRPVADSERFQIPGGTNTVAWELSSELVRVD